MLFSLLQVRPAEVQSRRNVILISPSADLLQKSMQGEGQIFTTERRMQGQHLSISIKIKQLFCVCSFCLKEVLDRKSKSLWGKVNP